MLRFPALILFKYCNMYLSKYHHKDPFLSRDYISILYETYWKWEENDDEVNKGKGRAGQYILDRPIVIIVVYDEGADLGALADCNL